LPGAVTTLTARRDFLAANSGKRAPMSGFVLLVRARDDGDPAMRVGYTVTKKIGNAVVRNRMKRRFRALIREVLPVSGVRGADHVLIGRAGGVERDFGTLRVELAKALKRISDTQIHSSPRPPSRDPASFPSQGSGTPGQARGDGKTAR
jgi:ribonuclease P protein component